MDLVSIIADSASMLGSDWGKIKMDYCFDIDGTLCTNTEGDYTKAVPLNKQIMFVINLIENGNRVVFFTARGSQTGIDWSEFTKLQLEQWGIPNPIIFFGKPHADLYIDDKAVESNRYWLNQGIV